MFITAEEPAAARRPGVIVTIGDLHRDFRSFDTYEGLQELTETFALYLINYRAVTIEVDGRRLDPEAAIVSQRRLTLPSVVDDDGAEHAAELHIIEWRSETRRTLYLCSRVGFPLDQVETRFHTPGFSFSAYLESTYVERLHNEERIGLSEMDTALAAVVEAARQEIDCASRPHLPPA